VQRQPSRSKTWCSPLAGQRRAALDAAFERMEAS
jgi:hypothetical protein